MPAIMDIAMSMIASQQVQALHFFQVTAEIYIVYSWFKMKLNDIIRGQNVKVCIDIA